MYLLVTCKILFYNTKEFEDCLNNNMFYTEFILLNDTFLGFFLLTRIYQMYQSAHCSPPGFYSLFLHHQILHFPSNQNHVLNFASSLARWQNPFQLFLCAGAHVNRQRQRTAVGWCHRDGRATGEQPASCVRAADEGTHYWATLTRLRRACFLSTAGMLLITQDSRPCGSGSAPNTMSAALHFVLQSVAPVAFCCTNFTDSVAIFSFRYIHKYTLNFIWPRLYFSAPNYSYCTGVYLFLHY